MKKTVKIVLFFMVLSLSAPTFFDWIEKENKIFCVSEFDDEGKQLEEKKIDFKIIKNLSNCVFLFLDNNSSTKIFVKNFTVFKQLNFISIFSPPPENLCIYLTARISMF